MIGRLQSDILNAEMMVLQAKIVKRQTAIISHAYTIGHAGEDEDKLLARQFDIMDKHID